MTMSLRLKPTKELARAVANCLTDTCRDWDALRDQCDLYTAGELDCFRLDLLTDWVETEIKQQLSLRTEAD